LNSNTFETDGGDLAVVQPGYSIPGSHTPELYSSSYDAGILFKL